MFHVVLERGRISTFASKMQVNLVLSYSSKMSKPEMSCYRPAPQNFSLFFWGGGQREDIQIHWIGLGFAGFGPPNRFSPSSYFRGSHMPQWSIPLLFQQCWVTFQAQLNLLVELKAILGHVLCIYLPPLLRRAFPITLFSVSQGWTQQGAPGEMLLHCGSGSFLLWSWRNPIVTALSVGVKMENQALLISSALVSLHCTAIL